MKKFVWAAVALAVVVVAVLGIAACGDSNKVPTGAIAKVGDGVVTQQEFDQYMNQARAAATQQANQAPFPSEGTAAYNQYKASLVDFLVQKQLLVNEAAKLKITISDTELNQQMQTLYQRNGGEKKVAQLAKQQGMTMDGLREYVKSMLLGNKVYTQVTSSAKPTEADMQAYYNKNKAQFDQKPSRSVRHILVKTKAQAEQLYAQLSANNTDAEWKTLAKQYSKDTATKNVGGSLGAIQKGAGWDPAFEKVAFSIPIGQVSKPVHSSFGWHVIEAVSANPGKASTYASAKATIQRTLSQQLVQQAWTKWLEQAKKDAGIVYAPGFDPAQLTAPASPAAGTGQSASPAPQPTSSKTK